MLFNNPLHETTRRVILPEVWENTPEQVQVNYYSYLTNRLIPSTDVYIGSRLIYRSNAIGCRGDDILPNKPILALFGDDYVHGSMDHVPFETLRIEPFQIVNCGIEDISLKIVVERVNEVNEAAPIACAVIVPPRHELAPVPNPVWAGSFYGPLCAEDAWRDELDKLPAGLDIVFLLPPTMQQWPDQALTNRLVRFLHAYGTEKGYRVLDGRGDEAPAPRTPGFKTRLSALLQRMAAALNTSAAPTADRNIVDYLRDRLAPRAPINAPPPQDALQAAPLPALDPAGHGPTDTGKNYPLW